MLDMIGRNIGSCFLSLLQLVKSLSVSLVMHMLTYRLCGICRYIDIPCVRMSWRFVDLSDHGDLSMSGYVDMLIC